MSFRRCALIGRLLQRPVSAALPRPNLCDYWRRFVHDNLKNVKRNNQRQRYPTTSSAGETMYDSLVTKYPDLESLRTERLKTYLEFMTVYGFKPHQAAEMVLLHSSLLASHHNNIPTAIDGWRNLGYELEDITSILTQHPQLSDISPITLMHRFAFLGKYFTRKEILMAIARSYEVVIENKDILDTKLKYLIHEFSHRPALVAKSGALSFSLSHIRTRHKFLIKAGIFIAVSFQKLHKKSYTINPSLERPNYFSPGDIVCTNDEDFIKCCTNDGLSINELAAFEELYEKELEVEAELDLNNSVEDEDSSDSEDEEKEIEKDESDYTEFQDSFSSKINNSNSASYFNKKDSADFYY